MKIIFTNNGIEYSSISSSNFLKNLLLFVILISFHTNIIYSVKILRTTDKGLTTKELIDEHPHKELSNFGINFNLKLNKCRSIEKL